MFEGVSSDVILALAKCSEIRAETSKWAESRRDALLAMSAVCATVGSSPSSQGRDIIIFLYKVAKIKKFQEMKSGGIQTRQL
jgi:hypothetical protein